MGLEVLFPGWLGSSTPGRAQTNTQTELSKIYRYKLATEITKQSCKAGLSHFLYIQPVCGYAFSARSKEESQGRIADGKGRVEGGTAAFEMKTKENERFQRTTKTVTGRESRRDERGDLFFLPVVDTASAAAIGVRTTHQRFVCSVRVN